MEYTRFGDACGHVTSKFSAFFQLYSKRFQTKWLLDFLYFLHIKSFDNGE